MGVVLQSLMGEDATVLHDRDFQALLGANFLAPLGVTLLSPILQSLTTPFAVSSTQIGLLIAAYTAPPIFLIPVAGVFADRYGRKPVLLSGMVLFGVAGMSIAFTTNFRVAVGLRVLQGVAFAGLTPIIITSLGDTYDGAREATAQGLRFTSSGVYQSVFPPLAGVLVAIGWRYPFFIYAMALPLAGVVYLWFDEPLDKETPNEDRESEGQDLGALAELVASGRVFALVLGRGLPMIPWVAFLTYNSYLVVQLLDGTSTQAGILVTVNSATLALGGSQAGRITARFDSRALPLAAANVGLGGGLALTALAPSLLWAAVGAAILGTSFGVSLSLYRSVVTGLAPATLRGGLVSVAESFGRVTATITPIGIGALIPLAAPMLGYESAVRWTVVGVGVAVAIGGQLCLIAARRSPKTPAELSD